ncbi:hypothetical protein NEMBOFW57_002402 [Staphylotrichum longicolle]|uniref:Pre-mRNA splicing factor CLF1 n=1 Tax=Staphylotrichum longicolle TaxID=669026 RepID=A0AAD4I1Q8_9PEZI|nr:hypothetical protein NEMBOFW57_002402 [Staphylotrichum longicolle]
MPLPQPKTALNNACSVIFNNTLYTYSADAFQSLRLESGAEWEELAPGEKVTGGVCVGSTTGTPATSAFFVVGGVSGTEGYHGLQKYTYSTGVWESIKLESKVTHQRLGHGAVYINSTDSILVYGGRQGGSAAPSSETFVIGASAPHAVVAGDSIAPASLNPILLPWSAGEAVMVGGSTWNTQVMLFNAAERRWIDSGASLAAPLPKDTTAMQAILMTATSAAATETPTTTPAAAVSGSSGPPLNTILGAALGGFFGLAILLGLIYFCIKRRQRRQAHMEAGHVRRASGASSSEKDGIGYAKDTLMFGQGPPGVFRGHQPQGSQSSFSSMAILMGRTNQSKSAPSGLSRKGSNDSRRDSSDSTFRAFKSTISKPMPQTTLTPAAPRPPPSQPLSRDEKGLEFAANTAAPKSAATPKPRNLTTKADKEGEIRRSSGWNRYWSGGSALNLLGFGSGNNNNSSNNNNAAANNTSQRITLVTDRSSDYSDRNRMTQDSATVPPLFPGSSEPRMSFSRVTAHSPTIAVYNDALKEGLSGRIETQRPISAVSDMSASAYSSGIPESVHEAWDPTAANRPWGADRSLNDSFTGVYSTPLAPASQGLKPLSGQVPPSQNKGPVRDDMSWLNLGGS